MQKKEVGVICSMSYHEMRLITAVLNRTILDAEVKGENTKKRIGYLLEKLNGMMIKQGFKQ